MGICSEGQTGPDNNGNGPLPGSKIVSSQLMEPKKLQVCGHHFNSDTRTVLTLLDILGIDYEFTEIDIFLGQHQDVKYLAKNPCGSIPMIIDNDCQLMGSPTIFVNYLTATKQRLQTYMPKEHQAKID